MTDSPQGGHLGTGKRTITFFVISDTHGDLVSESLVDKALEHRSQIKPDITIHLGDAFDFRWLRMGASEDERAEDIRRDIEQGLMVLERFKPDVFLWGNHDHRLNVCRERGKVDGPLRAFCNDIIESIADLRIPLVFPYCSSEGVFELGPMRFVHGYSHGQSALTTAARTYGKVMMGHIHYADQVTVASYDGAKAWSVACMFDASPDYIRKSPAQLRWSQGWAWGSVNLDTKDIQVWQHTEPSTQRPSAERSKRFLDGLIQKGAAWQNSPNVSGWACPEPAFSPAD
jgi:3',5'-cyclic AMP phosphodiesterase CpdA